MQAVCFVMGWVFASGYGVVLGGLFCHGVGVPQWQLYAVVFLVRGGLRKCKPFVLSWGGFLSAVFVPGVYSAVFVVRGGFRKCKPWSFLRCGFLQAVLVPCGAFCFVVGWVFPRGSCTQLCLLCWAVCVSARRLFCRGVFFCTRYWFMAGRFVLSSGGFFPGAVVRSCVCCAGRFA